MKKIMKMKMKTDIKTASTNEIEEFITDFKGSQYKKIIEEKFTHRYCYQFAAMLKATFQRGQICWAAPNEHFVWLDEDNTAYDVNGIYKMKEHHTVYYIPDNYLNDYLQNYLHIKNKYKQISKKQITDIIKNYCESNQIEYKKEIEDYFIDE